MNFTRVVIGALVIAAGLVGRESHRGVDAAAVRTHVTAMELDTTAVSGTSSRADSGAEGVAPRVDIYGNEVDFAVGDYRVDGTGDLYESHSPDTQVTRLGAPGV